MINIKKISIILLFLSLSVPIVLFNGCSSKSKAPIVTIDGRKLYLDDFMYDIYLIEAEGKKLEKYYLETLGHHYWDYEYEGVTLRDSAKNSILTRVVMDDILSDQAQKKGITLSEQERDDNKKAVNALMEAFPEEVQNKKALSPELISKAYDKKTLSDKYYRELSKSFRIDDKAIRSKIVAEELREYKTECLYIPTVTVGEDTLTPYNKEESTVALKEISEVLGRVKEGTEFNTIINEDNNLSYYARNFVSTDSIYEADYQNAAILLKDGMYSEIISTQYGYYIIHMLDNNSTERYEKAVKDAITKEEDRQFAEAYSLIKEQYDITIDFKYWDTIVIGNLTTE